MTTPLDFAVFPPELNSGRMYSGAGSGPMLAAASAWKALAAELRTTALSYCSVLSELTSQHWHGPASAAMAAAAAPFVTWVSSTAMQAEQTATQAEAAVAAYEAAFAATVPPPVVTANRVQLMVLIAGNILGQNTAAIAATEAQYTEMWAQDAAAMYGYASSSALATQLSAFTEPQQTTSPTALTQALATRASPAATQQSALAQLISSIPAALQGAANPAALPSSQPVGGLSGLLNVISGANDSAFGQFLNADIWNSLFASGFYMPGNFLGAATDFMGLTGQAGQTAGQVAGHAANAAAGPLSGLGTMGNSVSSVSAGLGRSSIIGTLSVPPSWTAPALLHSPLSASLGASPMISPPAVAAGTPAVPLAANAGAQGYGRAIPQYGFRPTFVARPPAAG